MSRKKYTKAEIDLIVQRTLDLLRLKTNKELAELLNETPQSFSNKKNTGSVVKLIEKEAYKRNLDLNFILTGIPEDLKVGEKQSSYGINQNTSNLLESARKVLTGQNRMAAEALEKNIRYFAYAIEVENRVERLEEQVKRQANELKLIKEKLLKDLSPKSIDSQTKSEPPSSSKNTA